MRTQIVSEIRKLTTTRPGWALLLAMTGVGAAFTAFIVLSGLNAPASPMGFDDPGEAVAAYNLVVAVAYVFPLAAGVLSVTQEYNSGTIATTLLAEPRRGRVYAGKLLVGFCTALLYGIVSVATCVLVASSLLRAGGKETFLGDGGVAGGVLGSIVVIGLWGAIGVGAGALIRNQVAAIVGLLLLTQFVEPVLRIVSASAGVPGLGSYLPGGAGDAAAGGTLLNLATAAPADQATGFLVIGGYTVVLTVLGGVRFARYELR